MAEIMAKLQKGKSVQKNSQPHQLKWYFYWGERIETVNLEAILRSPNMMELPMDPDSWDEYWADMQGRLVISLEASIGRWYGWAATRVDITSQAVPEIQKIYEERFKILQLEKARRNAQTPEERQAALDEALKLLGSSPGLFTVGPADRR